MSEAASERAAEMPPVRITLREKANPFAHKRKRPS